MINSRTIRIRRTETHTLALIDYSAEYIIEAWNLETDERQTVWTLEYRGNDDRIAARHIAQGALDTIDPATL